MAHLVVITKLRFYFLIPWINYTSAHWLSSQQLDLIVHVNVYLWLLLAGLFNLTTLLIPVNKHGKQIDLLPDICLTTIGDHTLSACLCWTFCIRTTVQNKFASSKLVACWPGKLHGHSNKCFSSLEQKCVTLALALTVLFPLSCFVTGFFCYVCCWDSRSKPGAESCSAPAECLGLWLRCIHAGVIWLPPTLSTSVIRTNLTWYEFIQTNVFTYIIVCLVLVGLTQ